MLPKSYVNKPNLQKSKPIYAKYPNKKIIASKTNKINQSQHECNDKQNQQNWMNISQQMVDINKKIRKRSPKKYNVSNNNKNIKEKQDKFNGFFVYKEEQLDMDSQMLKLTKPQRMDNDVDTDQEQVQTGLDKMMGFLRQACMQRMYQNYQSMDYE